MSEKNKVIFDNPETFYVSDLAVATSNYLKKEEHVDYSKTKVDGKNPVYLREKLKTSLYFFESDEAGTDSSAEG